MNKIINSTKNEFAKYASGLKLKKERIAHHSFLVEGEKCVRELLNHMPKSTQSIITLSDQFDDIVSLACDAGADVYVVAEHVMSFICDCKTPQGIAAIASIPENEDVNSGMIVMLDDVQDPQNVGTIIRTADAAGCSCVVLSLNTADCFAPKAVRASMGSIFHIPLIKTDLHGYIEKLIPLHYQIACAHLAGNVEFQMDWHHTCLIIGNESRGVSEAITNVSDMKIKIPIYGQAESLNAAVAAGILIYKIRS